MDTVIPVRRITAVIKSGTWSVGSLGFSINPVADDKGQRALQPDNERVYQDVSELMAVICLFEFMIQSISLD